MDIVEKRCEVPSIEGLVVAADDLDVLLRHRLLLEPGGFEGLVPVEKDLSPRGLAVVIHMTVHSPIPIG